MAEFYAMNDWRVEPRWKKYVRDRDGTLRRLIASLRADIRSYEDTYGLRFLNPSVAEPAGRVDALVEEAYVLRAAGRPEEARERADAAVLRQIQALFFVCKTAAASLIVDARGDIEQGVDPDRLGALLALHAAARDQYAAGNAVGVAFDRRPTGTFVRRVDEAMRHYRQAIDAAGQAFSPAWQ